MSSAAGERCYIDTAGASARLGVPARTLERWRSHRRHGPPYVKLPSGAIRYELDELEAWLKPGRKAV